MNHATDNAPQPHPPQADSTGQQTDGHRNDRPQKLTLLERRLLFSPWRLVIILATAIFVVEFLIMVLFWLFPTVSPLAEMLLDATLLTIVLVPVISAFVFKPLLHLIADYRHNEHQLQNYRTDLERQVAARTDQLDVTVRRLQNEIEERRRAEASITEHKDLLGTIIESIPSPIFYKDQHGAYSGCNQAFCTYLGRPREEIVGSTVYDIAPPHLAAVYHQADMDLMARGGTQTYETQVRYADDTLHDVIFYKSVMQRHDGSLLGLVGVMLDITELKRVEAEKDTLAQSLLHTQKIESIGRLAGGVAHDFNNLLTPILGYTEMLTTASGRDERSRTRLNGIRDAALKARDLTRQLLAFSRKQVLEMKPVDLNQVIEAFALILERTIREDIAVSHRLDPLLGSILADRSQIEQIIMNLAINAQDAMPEGGSLLIGTRNVSLDATSQRTPDLAPGDYVMLTISDSGCGMDAEVMGHIFEPFFTTKPEGKGTGLGLATVFGIVKQHGGQIDVLSAPGQGTTITIYFPRNEEAPVSALAAEEIGTTPAQRNTTILLVEDNPMVLEMARELLNDNGYRVVACDDPQKAVALLKAQPGPVDLLLTDVVMPGMNGPALYESLKSMQPGLRVLFMSGYNDAMASNLHLLDDSRPCFIQKPFTAQALLKKLESALEHTT